MVFTRDAGVAAAAIGIVISGGVSMIAFRGNQDPIFSEAEAYERFMGRWSRELAPQLVRFAAVRDGDRLLDVGSGTGALTAALAAAAPSSRIIGIDPAASYVARAQARQGGALVPFVVGDAQQMGFQHATFDRTLSLLVLNFIPDAHKAVDEMKRVTRRGGPSQPLCGTTARGWRCCGCSGTRSSHSGQPATPKDERHMPFCRRGDLSALWRRHGLQDVVEEGLTIQTRFTSFDDYWAPFLEKQGPAGAYVGALSQGERDALEQSLRRRLLRDGPNRPFVLKMSHAIGRDDRNGD